LKRVTKIIPCKGGSDQSELIRQALFALWRSAYRRGTRRWATLGRWCVPGPSELGYEVLVSAGLLAATSSGQTESKIRYV
jgi:hypothetical protein